MPNWLDTPGEFLTVLSITVVVMGGLIWLIKAVTAIQHETRPNSGASLRDAVDRIERKLDNHIAWHLEEKE